MTKNFDKVINAYFVKQSMIDNKHIGITKIGSLQEVTVSSFFWEN